MVDILLATYNGEKYLREQLDSLLAQTYQDFRIVIRDDGSTDATMDIIKEYLIRHGEKIVLIRDDRKCGSPAKNFMELMKHTRADYIMFCDQDDVWLPDKVQKMLVRMQAEEKSSADGAEPILLFTDYYVVDADLKVMDVPEDSLQIAKHFHSFNRLLVQNYITGCTCMINKTACLLAGEYDERILMHDWWVALYVSAMGHIVHFPEKLMYYRQHGGNDVGAKNVKSFRYRLEKMLDPDTRRSKDNYFAQAELLKERFRAEMNEHSTLVLDGFLRIRELPKTARVKALIDGGYLKSDLVRNLGFMLYI
jgi:glycosyltransferase involved in cell wall biosynthesis